MARDDEANVRSRLVFDDADAHMVDAEEVEEGVDVARANDARGGARAPRVLTMNEEVTLTASGRKNVSMNAFARLNASLGDFFRPGEKRERVASPAVKSNRRKNASGGRADDISRVARDMASTLDEPKVFLIARAIDTIGEARCREFAEEAVRAQSLGGELTATGERKRTTGGIFWARVRAQCAAEEVYLIFEEEREKQKQRAKIRRARAAAMGKENVAPAPTMAQILFGSIRQEHLAPRSPLATLAVAPASAPASAVAMDVNCEIVTPQPTMKTSSWADDVDELPAAPMKARATPTFAPPMSFRDAISRGL